MLFPPKAHRFFFLFGIISLGFGMMIGAVPTSVPQFFLLINWLLEGDFKNKWLKLKSNKLFWCLEIIFCTHVLGLLYTGDLKAGVSDLQIKLPLMILPLVLLSTKPMNAREIRWTFYAFLFGAVVNTAWCLIYSFVLDNTDAIRNTSRFMSHIRLGLYLNMAIATAVYFFRKSESNLLKVAYSSLIVYFIAVMYALGLASGLSILLILAFCAGVWIMLKQHLVLKLLALLVLTVSTWFMFHYVKEVVDGQLIAKAEPNNTLLNVSPSGRSYIHFDTLGQKENGYYIHQNIQLEELQKEWKRRCPEDTFSFPPNAFNLKRYVVLIRYLASMGLNKDSVGVSTLSQGDINSIKSDVANKAYSTWSNLHRRVYELVNEYANFISNRNINGQSLTMRLYFWKAALLSIQEHPFIGVGTGDVQFQLNQTYIKSNSPLFPEWYKRPHNQFLTFAVALGLLGLVAILFSLFYPVYLYRRELNMLYFSFLLVYLISFLIEDTVETQAGATFYAFFNSFLFMEVYFKKQQNPEG